MAGFFMPMDGRYAALAMDGISGEHSGGEEVVCADLALKLGSNLGPCLGCGLALCGCLFTGRRFLRYGFFRCSLALGCGLLLGG